MMSLELVRFKLLLSDVTFGLLKSEERLICLTLELPWKNNEHDVSCIPTGEYTCERVFNRSLASGTKIPITYEVMGVPDRSGILFHVGNSHNNTHGCILPGLSLGPKDMILQSEAAFSRFLRVTDNLPAFTIRIREA